MPINALAAAAQRALLRETAGAVLRAKAKRADNLERIAELVNLRASNARNLDREDFAAAGAQDNVHPSVIHAIANAESGALGGFDHGGRMIILVEPHIFSALTLHAFDRSHPWLSYPTWTPYRPNQAPPGRFQQHPYAFDQDNRWALVAQMAELDVDAAIGSMSAGRFQQLIGSPRPDMGWKLLRFASAEALFRKLAHSERDQLEVLRLFFTANGAMGALREKNWRVIARVYNGPGQVDRYAEILEREYRRCGRLYA
jgi:hypothetical protein